MSDANLAYLAYVPEVTWGIVPAPAALKKMRFTREGLKHAKQTTQSAEIRDDRQIGELVQVGVQAEGPIDFELAVADFDPFLEAALFGTWSGAGAAATLANGVVRHSFDFEKKLATGAFQSFRGVMINELTLNLNSRQIITGAMACMGITGLAGAATIDTAAGVDPAGTGRILAASTNVANINEGGAPIATGIKSLRLTINNNLRFNDVIGNVYPDAIGLGECVITGTVVVYFKDNALLTKFQNHTTSALTFDATYDNAGTPTGYHFNLPKVQFSDGNADVAGKNTDLMQTINFQAVADPGAFLMQISRLP